MHVCKRIIFENKFILSQETFGIIDHYKTVKKLELPFGIYNCFVVSIVYVHGSCSNSFLKGNSFWFRCWLNSLKRIKIIMTTTRFQNCVQTSNWTKCVKHRSRLTSNWPTTCYRPAKMTAMLKSTENFPTTRTFSNQSTAIANHTHSHIE